MPINGENEDCLSHMDTPPVQPRRRKRGKLIAGIAAVCVTVACILACPAIAPTGVDGAEEVLDDDAVAMAAWNPAADGGDAGKDTADLSMSKEIESLIDAEAEADAALDVVTPESRGEKALVGIEPGVQSGAAEQSAAEAPAAQGDGYDTLSNNAAPADTSRSTHMAPKTLNIDGVVLSYIDTYDAASAPKYGAGLWDGSDSTTDGTYGYFIGHNPGDFNCVMYLSAGDPVSVMDRNGASRTYHVAEVFEVSRTTKFGQIEARIKAYGECIVLQTCVPEQEVYRIVIAQ